MTKQAKANLKQIRLRQKELESEIEKAGFTDATASPQWDELENLYYLEAEYKLGWRKQ